MDIKDFVLRNSSEQKWVRLIDENGKVISKKKTSLTNGIDFISSEWRLKQKKK